MGKRSVKVRVGSVWAARPGTTASGVIRVTQAKHPYYTVVREGSGTTHKMHFGTLTRLFQKEET